MVEADCVIENLEDTSSSLQASFDRFRRQRMEQLKSRKIERRTYNREDPEFRAELRRKFIERAKYYIGVPYAKKYHQPGTEAYDSPIFLDCCGLVRQVMLDLKDEFGFCIGRWNQAYQYDMLPAEIPFEEMQPGDLIFYSATFYDSKMKKQIHNMVHVEIFLGGETGEQTIGSRWQEGRVQLFDSYKFISKRYYDVVHHYKSIESWLRGICVSHCTQHSWRDDRREIWLPRNSIFNEEAEEYYEESTPM